MRNECKHVTLKKNQQTKKEDSKKKEWPNAIRKTENNMAIVFPSQSVIALNVLD